MASELEHLVLPRPQRLGFGFWLPVVAAAYVAGAILATAVQTSSQKMSSGTSTTTAPTEIDLSKPKRDRAARRWVIFLKNAPLWFGAILTIGVAYFAYMQINAATWASITSQTLDIDKTFIAKPELQPYFFSGKDIDKSDPDYGKVFAQAELMLDYLDYAASMKPYVAADAYGPVAWNNFDAMILTSSPIMCRIAKEDAAIYDPNFNGIVAYQCRQKRVPRSTHPDN